MMLAIFMQKHIIVLCCGIVPEVENTTFGFQ